MPPLLPTKQLHYCGLNGDEIVNHLSYALGSVSGLPFISRHVKIVKGVLKICN